MCIRQKICIRILFDVHLLSIFILLTVSYKTRLISHYSVEIGVLIITYCFVFAFGGRDGRRVYYRCKLCRSARLGSVDLYCFPLTPLHGYVSITFFEAGIVDSLCGKHCWHTHTYRACAPRTIIIDKCHGSRFSVR